MQQADTIDRPEFTISPLGIGESLPHLLYDTSCEVGHLLASVDLLIDALDETGAMVDPRRHGIQCGKALRLIRSGLERVEGRLVDGEMLAERELAA